MEIKTTCPSCNAIFEASGGLLSTNTILNLYATWLNAHKECRGDNKEYYVTTEDD